MKNTDNIIPFPSNKRNETTENANPKKIDFATEDPNNWTPNPYPEPISEKEYLIMKLTYQQLKEELKDHLFETKKYIRQRTK